MIKESAMILDALKSSFEAKSKVQNDAFTLLLEIGLPHKRSEAYKYTPIVSILEKNIDWNRSAFTSFDKSKLYRSEGSHVVTIDGMLAEEYSVILDGHSIKQNDVSEGKHDPFSLMNTALSRQEISIESTSSENPIFLYHFTNGFSNPRTKVHVKDGDQISIVEKIISQDKSFTNSYIEFNVGKNAVANHTRLQNYSSETYTHESTFAHVARDGKFINNTFSFEGAMVRNSMTVNIEDENCEAYMYGLFLLDKKSHVDNNTSVDHQKPNTYSNELYKGILDEKSTGVFNGKIYVRQEAQKTNAFQSNNNILLSDDATLNTKPQLEIWADDVKCSHGCTSGQLDEDAIFYLRARGIDEKSAKGMIINAFAGETMEQLHIDEVKEEVQSLIDQKLS
ncbi:MAG: Fe-S cluster assembly protein SufD [Ekhidna sp.]